MGKTIEERIKELEEKYRLLTDNLIDAIWVVDLESMTYDYVSPSIRRVSGFNADELIGTPIKHRVAEDSLGKIMAAVEEALARLEKGFDVTRTLEIEMTHKYGRSYWVEITVKILKEKNRLKVIGVSRDITQQKISVRKQENLIDELRKTLAEKEKLLRENRMLRKILPICSGCRRIRDENDRWWPLDIYVERHTRSNFSHTICGDCQSVMYEDL